MSIYIGSCSIGRGDIDWCDNGSGDSDRCGNSRSDNGRGDSNINRSNMNSNPF